VRTKHSPTKKKLVRKYATTKISKGVIRKDEKREKEKKRKGLGTNEAGRILKEMGAYKAGSFDQDHESKTIVAQEKKGKEKEKGTEEDDRKEGNQWHAR